MKVARLIVDIARFRAPDIERGVAEHIRHSLIGFARLEDVTVTFEGIADDAASPDKQENT